VTDFRVWAPRATRMTLELDGRRHPMTAEADGWWSVTADGQDYGYLIDDAQTPHADPRSRWQPDGVHGLSRVFDPAAHRWQDAAWTGRQLAGGIVYELHVGTFTPEGTLDAAIGRLDHLVELGVDFVELLPVNAFNGEWNWGYDGVLWYAVQQSYGGPAAYQRFVDACHARGLAVIQDVVCNHLGPSGNYLPEFGPYLHEGGPGNTWGASLNLDGPDSDAVREHIIGNALMWLHDYHVDGLRLDAVHALVDHRAVHLLEELAERVDALSAHVGRPLTLIAESDLNDPRMIRPREAHGLGMTAQWSDDFHHAVRVAVSGETVGYYEDFAPLAALREVFERGFFHAGTHSSFRGRVHGRPLDASTPAWRLVVFDQDHDQVGNRAAGDRLAASVDEGGLAIASALTLLSPFTPMLFMGEEWAASTPWQFFTSHPEPELGRATAEGRIAEFARMGWDPTAVPDPQDPETFHRSKLDWSEPYPEADQQQSRHARMLRWYRRLIGLRRERAELTDPMLSATHVEIDDEARTVLVHRGPLVIAVNLGPAGAATTLGGSVLLHSGELADDPVPDSADALVLPARSVVVVDTGSRRDTDARA
jgi:maltooligosyltrehalose trehalohydrolase